MVELNGVKGRSHNIPAVKVQRGNIAYKIHLPELVVVGLNGLVKCPTKNRIVKNTAATLSMNGEGLDNDTKNTLIRANRKTGRVVVCGRFKIKRLEPKVNNLNVATVK